MYIIVKCHIFELSFFWGFELKKVMAFIDIFKLLSNFIKNPLYQKYIVNVFDLDTYTILNLLRLFLPEFK